MSSRGLLAKIYQDGKPVGDGLMIGEKVPRLHHSDGIPVYLVAAHDDGVPVSHRSGRLDRLLAYPSAWPAPGHCDGRVIFATHERLPWLAPIPLFDVEEDPDGPERA